MRVWYFGKSVSLVHLHANGAREQWSPTAIETDSNSKTETGLDEVVSVFREYERTPRKVSRKGVRAAKPPFADPISWITPSGDR
ncbi:hypothetical protein GWI33_014373 [Rhynchophorus ferrugineus]|uniref:Uncharacterized protein n=1 Tax=Rhynchophorus ferrugineus TaxID=354439 RepID=A0A834MAR8_RHYFE|nr:hypothetical protein GWI33_014373 [Rhynchophorus ferrugineus]